jgi:uncharacterized oligopeptide transporter (OPT) family protein
LERTYLFDQSIANHAKIDLAIHVENWGWFIQFTPAFIGSGMLVGLNVSISFFAGSVIAWYVSN